MEKYTRLTEVEELIINAVRGHDCSSYKYDVIDKAIDELHLATACLSVNRSELQSDTTELRNFLNKHDAIDKFPVDIDIAVRRPNPISDTFVWEHTLEGKGYWMDINEKWENKSWQHHEELKMLEEFLDDNDIRTDLQYFLGFKSLTKHVESTPINNMLKILDAHTSGVDAYTGKWLRFISIYDIASELKAFLEKRGVYKEFCNNLYLSYRITSLYEHVEFIMIHHPVFGEESLIDTAFMLNDSWVDINEEWQKHIA